MAQGRRARGDGGFTLIEVIIGIAVMSILVGAIGTGAMTMLRTTKVTTERLAVSHDSQLLSSWIGTDLQSAGSSTNVDVNPATATGCASSPAQSAGNFNAFRLTWTDRTGPTTYFAAYRIQQLGTALTLVRYFCVGGQTAVSFPVVRTLKDNTTCSAAQSATASVCVLTPSGNRMSVRVTSLVGASSYTFTATATVRAATAGLPTSAPAVQAVVAYNTDSSYVAGYINRIVVTFDGPLASPYTAGTAPWTLGGTVPNGATISAVAVAGNTATLTLSGATGSPTVTTTTGLTLALAQATGGIRDGLGNRSSFAARPVSDWLAPVPTGITPLDTNSDGRLDGISLPMSEALLAGALNPALFVITTPTGAAWAGVTLAATSATAAGSAVTLAVSATAGTIPVDMLAGGLGVAYAADPTGVRDTGGAWGGYGSVAIIPDTTPPSLLSARSQDTNRDGRLDQIVLTFNEPLNTSYTALPGAGWTFAGWPGAAPTVTAVAIAGTTATLTIGGTVPANDTVAAGLTIALAATANGVRDIAGNLASFAATAVADGMAPACTGLSARDTNGDGRLDQVVLSCSEALATPVTAPSSVWTFAGSAGSSVSAVAVSGTTATLTVAGAPVNTATTGVTLTLAADPTGLRDAAGNQTAFTTAALTDQMAPVVTTIRSRDNTPATRDGVLDAIDVTFSEPLAATYTPASNPWTIVLPTSSTPPWTTATASVASVAFSGSTATLSLAGTNIPIDTAANGLALGMASLAGGVKDPVGNLAAAFATQAVADGMAPVCAGYFGFAGFPARDLNSDGRMDQLTLSCSEPLATAYSAPSSVWTLAGSTGSTVSAVAVAGSGATLTIAGAPVNTATTGVTLALAANAGGLRDAAGNQASFGASALLDQMAPIVTSIVARDTITSPATAVDGRMDQIQVTFSESLAAYTAPNSVWALAWTGNATTISGVSVSGAVATITTTATNVQTDTVNLTLALTANANGIRDAANNQSSFAATAVTDAMSPILTTTPTFTQVATGGIVGRFQQGDSVTFTFSEAILASSVPASTTVTLDGTGATNTLAIAGVLNGTLNLGTAAYIGNKTAVFSGSTVAVNAAAKTVVVTLGTCGGSGNPCNAINNTTAAAATLVTPVPATTMTDPTGNPATGRAAFATPTFSAYRWF